MSDVTVIGLGPMGSRLAELLVEAGKSVTVWNRSPDKTEPIIARGATLANSAADAVSASPITLICVATSTNACDILHGQGCAEAIKGRQIVNLSLGQPEDAIRFSNHVEASGGGYLDCLIQATPPGMGTADSALLISGQKACFRTAEPLLQIIAHKLIHVGEKVEAANIVNSAALSCFFGSLAGLLHGAAICEKIPFDVARFGDLMSDVMPGYTAILHQQAQVIGSGDFSPQVSPVVLSLVTVREIANNSRKLGVKTELLDLVEGWLIKAENAGLGNEELASVIKVLRGEV